MGLSSKRMGEAGPPDRNGREMATANASNEPHRSEAITDKNNNVGQTIGLCRLPGGLVYVVCLADHKKRWSAPQSAPPVLYRALDHGHCSAVNTSPAFTEFCSTYSISSHNSWSERIQ